MDRDTVLRDQVLVVEDGRIARVGPRASTRIPSGARRIDAEGARWIRAAEPTM
jgi:imidazolonepropionase-like amidohydrolase